MGIKMGVYFCIEDEYKNDRFIIDKVNNFVLTCKQGNDFCSVTLEKNQIKNIIKELELILKENE